MTFVLDNSVAICWMQDHGKAADRTYARKVLQALKEVRAIVPSLWALKAANVLTREEAKGLISEAHSQAFIEMLLNLPITTDTATASQALSATIALARAYKLSAYAAAYLELAMREGVPIATLDKDLEKAARQAGVSRFEPK